MRADTFQVVNAFIVINFKVLEEVLELSLQAVGFRLVLTCLSTVNNNRRASFSSHEETSRLIREDPILWHIQSMWLASMSKVENTSISITLRRLTVAWLGE